METIALRKKVKKRKIRILECIGSFFSSFSKVFKADIDSDWIESIASRDGREYNFPKRRSFYLGQQSKLTKG